MRLLTSPNKIPATLIALTLLTGCGGQQFDFDLLSFLQKTRMESAYKKAEALTVEGRPVEAAAVLWEFAPNLPPPHRQDMQVRAADILLDAKRPLDARRYLLQISEEHIEGAPLLRKRVTEARFYRQTGQPEKILRTLPPPLVKKGDKQTKIAAFELLSDVLMAGEDFIRGIEMRVALHRMLDKERRPANLAALWRGLLHLDPVQVMKHLSDDPDRIIRPWLELAALATPLEVNFEVLEREYAAWEHRNRRWPLPDSVTEELRARWRYLDYQPQKVALLLPLTGSYEKAGKAIRDGFLESNNANTTPVFTVTIHNTDQAAAIPKVYSKAVSDGDVDLVIGPLLKSEVNALIVNGSINVPTISLNYVTTSTLTTPDDLFQFGLLPEDEAVQAARRMWGDGHEFIAVLTPDDEWGERLYRAFSEEYTALGGVIRAVSHYDRSFVDYTVVIQSLLQLDRSRERHRLVSVALGEKPRSRPRIRDDVSASMLFTDHRRAVMIFPQMKFHYADKLPTYATSHAYQPGASKGGRDLDGLIYCDIPAVIRGERFADGDAGEHTGEYARLFALGMDAQRLVKRFRYMKIGHYPFSGETGEIFVETNQRLFRKLPWAQISRGRPVPIDVL